jgi:Major intrinsic protein
MPGLPAPGTHQPPSEPSPTRPSSPPAAPPSKERAPSAADLSVTASAPQTLRIGGLVDVLERLEPGFGEATCEFGAAGSDDADVVPCVCDAVAGSMECMVPEGRSEDGDLRVRAKIGNEFESPVLYMKYRVERVGDGAGQNDRNVVLYGADEHVTAAKRRSLQVRVLERVTGEGDASRAKRYSIWHQCLAEAVGVAIIVVFGVGSVCCAVLFPGGLTGLWEIAVVWGFGVALAIACTASVSGGACFRCCCLRGETVLVERD